MTSTYFVYKLLPPRPTFPADMSAEESAIMHQHAGYWGRLLTEGQVVVFGPVADPAGVWGLVVVEAASVDDVRALGAEDPAVKSGMTTFDVYAMPVATARPWRP